MSQLDRAEVLFQGSKCFWKTRNTIEIVLVEHNNFDVIEIVTYEPAFAKEAERIYLKNSLIASKLNPEDIREKIRKEKEMVLRRHEVPNSQALNEDTLKKCKSQFIVNRLFIADYFPISKLIRVEFRLNFHSSDASSQEGVVCERPVQLQPYVFKHKSAALM